MQVTLCDYCKKEKAIGSLFFELGSQQCPASGRSEETGENRDFCGPCSFKALKEIVKNPAETSIKERWQKNADYLYLLSQKVEA